MTESYLEDNIAPVVLGRSAYEREAIWQELWNIDRNLTFFPVYLPGPVDVALWDMACLLYTSKRTRTAVETSILAGKQLWACGCMENRLQELKHDGERAEITIKPYEILTLRIS